MTPDTRCLTPDTWGEHSLEIWDRQCLEDSELKDEPLPISFSPFLSSAMVPIPLMNYKGICRTAPATPGLASLVTDPSLVNSTSFNIHPFDSHQLYNAKNLKQLSEVEIVFVLTLQCLSFLALNVQA